MKKSIQILILIATAYSLVSCGISRKITSGETTQEKSSFKESFSIGSIIEAHQDLLINGPRTLSGMEAGPREPFVQSHEYMTIQVDSDETTILFESITSDVEEALSNSGATIIGHGGNDAQLNPVGYFSYSYSEGPIYVKW
ncbi:MAG: hypothetical protein MUO62_14480 [Anaerolineales bacterium]|nr:hypothetical protein [Anaerolineales bacterium]